MEFSQTADASPPERTERSRSGERSLQEESVYSMTEKQGKGGPWARGGRAQVHLHAQAVWVDLETQASLS